MGWPPVFPAIASFGAAIGLGFLSQYEGSLASCCPMFAGMRCQCCSRRVDARRYRPDLGAGSGVFNAGLRLAESGLLYVGLALMVGIHLGFHLAIYAINEQRHGRAVATEKWKK